MWAHCKQCRSGKPEGGCVTCPRAIPSHSRQLWLPCPGQGQVGSFRVGLSCALCVDDKLVEEGFGSTAEQSDSGNGVHEMVSKTPGPTTMKENGKAVMCETFFWGMETQSLRGRGEEVEGIIGGERRRGGSSGETSKGPVNEDAPAREARVGSEASTALGSARRAVNWSAAVVVKEGLNIT